MSICRICGAIALAAAGLGVGTPLAAEEHASDGPAVSRWVYRGASGHLVYRPDDRGNRIPDFSRVGYRFGTQPLPDVDKVIPRDRWVTVPPAEGSMVNPLQAAIDKVSAMPRMASGFRGVVALQAGVYEIAGPLSIRASGVVLRGAGPSHREDRGSIIRSTSRQYRTNMLIVGPAEAPRRERVGEAVAVVDSYVPVGAMSFRVADASKFKVGDAVIVRRPGTDAWIAAMSMDQLNKRFGDADWKPNFSFVDLHFERTIVGMDGDRLFLDAPLPNALEQAPNPFGGGEVFHYRFPRLENIGIEKLRGMCVRYSDTDENHPFTFIHMDHVANGWVREVSGKNLGYAVVCLGRQTRNITGIDLRNMTPQSRIKGARRYAFDNQGQYNLMRDLFAEHGRHDFVNNGPSRGPNVFVFGRAVAQKSPSGPHQRWSVGTLYDSLAVGSQKLAVHNRGSYGSGHGHAGGAMVFWNSSAEATIVENPPAAQNWAIGATGGPVLDYVGGVDFTDTPIGYVDSAGQSVDLGDPEHNPKNSLYVAQLRELREIGLPRTYLLGDFDSCGHGPADDPADRPSVDPAWQQSVERWMTRHDAVMLPMDAPHRAAGKVTVTPWTWRFELPEDRPVCFAQLTVALADHGDDAMLMVGDTDRTLATGKLDLTNPAAGYPRGKNAIVVIEFADRDGCQPLAALAKGLLNLAVTNATVDWAELRLHLKPTSPAH